MIFKKLPKDFKRKWITALRSGKFKQGQKTLFNKEENTYCCLGVAAEICGVKNLQKSNYIRYKKDTPLRGVRLVPKQLRGNSRNLLVYELSNMNDSTNQSFKQIANWIEKNL